jgi:S-formylglutathione hydrolase FrmB
MALLQAMVMSRALMRNVPMQVILPVDRLDPSGRREDDGAPLKTLYLLHGIFGSCASWVAETRIKRWAEERGLAVVMPSGDNGFYVDRPVSFNRFGEFVGEELVELTRRMFPLSARREDTYIAGLSMGGFGALRNGLRYHRTFGAIAALSSAFVLEGWLDPARDDPRIARNRGYYESCFGDLSAALGSDKNPKFLVDSLLAEQARGPETRLPRIYLACGTEDALLANNRDFRDFLRSRGVDFSYEEGPGAHDWDFWDAQIKKVLDWLPLI